MLTGSYLEFHKEVQKFMPKERIFTDPFYTYAYGTDASLYRLIPKIVLQAEKSEEVAKIMKACSKLSLPYVFRAAGTSLCGQCVTDSVLITTSRDWNKMSTNDDGSLITMEPAVIATKANAFLAPFGRIIGPDAASINSAMIGGTVANNASGMSCGTLENSYTTLQYMKIIFEDGTELDTGSPESIESFKKSHKGMIEKISALAKKVNDNKALREKIIRKFKIKNTCGYGLNSLVDFDDPIEIIQHLLVGSEGTLGFIKEVTFRTIVDKKHKASALMIFKSMKDALDAVGLMRTRCNSRTKECDSELDEAELMDREALRCVEDNEGMPAFLKTLSEGATALLVQIKEKDEETLDKNIEIVMEAIKSIEPELPIQFTKDPAEYGKFWHIRKGIFTTVGSNRPKGTACIIEDVAYPMHTLTDGILELQEILKNNGYMNAVIYGHVLDGNVHFILTPDMSDPAEVERFGNMLQDVANSVATKFHGSLKAEHGTGRNMAPFVELEWGTDAYEVMKEIKDIFDPKGIINPDVIINKDPKGHLKNFKALPITNDLIDKCIECGFCEPFCPSNTLTTTPRQRITTTRYAQTLKNRNDMEGYEAFKKLMIYPNVETCATCSLCSLACPVGIDTGALIKQGRTELLTPAYRRNATFIANNYAGVLGGGRAVLSVVKVATDIIPHSLVNAMSAGVSKLSGGKLPRWSASLPGGHAFKDTRKQFGREDKVVYFSSCLNRTMGNPKPSKGEKEVDEIIIGLLEKAGYEVIIPQNLKPLCCGMAFSSKGYVEQGLQKSRELEAELNKASENGKYPIVCDMSSCTKTTRTYFETGLTMYDPVEFIHDFLLEKLPIKQIDEPILVHAICSTRKAGLFGKLENIAKICSSKVTIPEDVGCCGWAGDRGWNYPELNKAALRHLKPSIPAGTKLAFSTGKPCEIGLTEASELPYRNLFYLVDCCVG